MRRIRRGEIRPADQLALMAEGRRNAPKRDRSTRLHKVAAAQVARVHQIWKHSPVVKVVPDTLRDEAVQRMTARKVTGEKVKDIAADLWHLAPAPLPAPKPSGGFGAFLARPAVFGSLLGIAALALLALLVRALKKAV